jgi:hypothetical protein
MEGENISLFSAAGRFYDSSRRLNAIHKGILMKARQRLAALAAATGITFSIVWALASYASNAMPLPGVSTTAGEVVHVQVCS